MKLNKIFILTFCLVLISTSLFSQEVTEIPQEEPEKRFELFRTPKSHPQEDMSFLNCSNLTLEITPGFYLNSMKNNGSLIGQNSSPVFPFSVGFIWPNYTSLAVAPSLSFFWMNHLWYNGTAYPAEIENRTSQTFNFILNIPLTVSLYLEKGIVQISPGFSFLPRFAVLANGISENDAGDTGTAGGDVIEINKWFWQNARYLYFSFSVTYLFDLSETVKGGPIFHSYFPIGTIASGEGVQGMIISFGMKLEL